MKRILFETVLVCLVLVLLAVDFLSRPSRAKAAERIEYKVVTSEDASNELEPALNRYAADGWELIAVARPEGHNHTLILKRIR
jgi:Domain of unknown function (DUF4177)